MILGVDFGLRKIGIAYSEGLYASPLMTISNAPSRVLQIKERFTEPVEKVVIGIPNSFLDPQVHAFADELKDAFKCEIIYEDETNTSNEAMEMMIKTGVPQKKRENDDSYAAVAILQRYLDKINEASDTNL